MHKHRHKFLLTLAILLMGIFGFGGFFIALNYLAAEKIYPGIKVAGIKISGLSPDTAHRILEERVSKFKSGNIVFKIEDNIYSGKTEELGIKIDIEKTIDKAFRVGRGRGLFSNFAQQSKALIGRFDLPVNFDFNEELFQKWRSRALKEIESPAQNAMLMFNDGKNDFDVLEAEEGVVIDENQFKERLFFKIQNLSDETINLSLVKDLPEIRSDKTETARNRAKMILEKAPYKIKFESKEWDIDKDQLLEWLSFIPIENFAGEKILGVSLDQELIRQHLTALSPSISRRPTDAELKIEGDRVTAFTLSQDGVSLLIEDSARKITDKILNYTNEEIELMVEITPPEVTMESISALGLTSLLGRGESNFAGSPANRVHNIKVGAARYNGILIKPGEEFSFNELLGPVGPRQGYLPELVIKQGKTIPEYGGGLCQVSTTTFRAAVKSGFKITERYPHSYPVKYYDPQGFDATIYPPHPDLRFINNTSAHILIQTRVVGSKLIFEIYGTDDGREVKIDGPYQYDIKRDASMKARLGQEVWLNGELIEKQDFYSSYKSPGLFPVEKNPLE